MHVICCTRKVVVLGGGGGGWKGEGGLNDCEGNKSHTSWLCAGIT